ncbi:MAG: Tex family protein [Eubacteriales bacterium]|nr:Tex family protein [Eubacteriales bacterium]
MNISQQLEKEFNLKQWQVDNVISLIDSGNTIPFIARYRKEATGSLDDITLRAFHERYTYLCGLKERKEEIIRLIDEQGKLTEELVQQINAAEKMSELEDIYRPYRPKKRTRATIAKERGLEPLAIIVKEQNLKSGDIDEICNPFITDEVPDTKSALAGAMDIIAEEISDNADFRKFIRNYTFRNGVIVTSSTDKKLADNEKGHSETVYEMYADFSEPVAKIANHRVLAIDRGEREEYLRVKITAEEQPILDYLNRNLVPKNRSITSEYVELAAQDAYNRLIKPSVEREIRNEKTIIAQEGAIKVFSANLSKLLLQPPVRDKVVLGFDPAYRTGCKLAVVDGTGAVLDTAVIYPTPPNNKVEEAEIKVTSFVRKYDIDLVAIGNGTASKESEMFISDLIGKLDRQVKYAIVNEAGASVYSASPLGAEEFPEYDVSLRSAVSIARRLQDPLAELVKIDPKSIGVGQYQHDMNQKKLAENLGGVVEDCVNSVGVDLNTASPSLLSYIAGINKTVATNIVKYREQTGKFTKRSELKKVPKLGSKAFEQCAGFLRIPGGGDVLDNTSVHPESYGAAKKLLELTGKKLSDIGTKEFATLNEINGLAAAELAEKCGIGVPTLCDIIDALQRPGRDPRDELPEAQLSEGVMNMEDLRPGQVLTGTVRNVADFGAFVDIGVHQDGLVHISQISDKFVRSILDAVSVGDIVKVKVLDVDPVKKRISLTMKL